MFKLIKGGEMSAKQNYANVMSRIVVTLHAVYSRWMKNHSVIMIDGCYVERGNRMIDPSDCKSSLFTG